MVCTTRLKSPVKVKSYLGLGVGVPENFFLQFWIYMGLYPKRRGSDHLRAHGGHNLRKLYQATTRITSHQVREGGPRSLTKNFYFIDKIVRYFSNLIFFFLAITDAQKTTFCFRKIADAVKTDNLQYIGLSALSQRFHLQLYILFISRGAMYFSSTLDLEPHRAAEKTIVRCVQQRVAFCLQ